MELLPDYLFVHWHSCVSTKRKRLTEQPGFSDTVKLYFKKGTYKLVLSLEDYEGNMNGTVNKAVTDYVRVTKFMSGYVKKALFIIPANNHKAASTTLRSSS